MEITCAPFMRVSIVVYRSRGSILVGVDFGFEIH